MRIRWDAHYNITGAVAFCICISHTMKAGFNEVWYSEAAHEASSGTIAISSPSLFCAYKWYSCKSLAGDFIAWQHWKPPRQCPAFEIDFSCKTPPENAVRTRPLSVSIRAVPLLPESAGRLAQWMLHNATLVCRRGANGVVLGPVVRQFLYADAAVL